MASKSEPTIEEKQRSREQARNEGDFLKADALKAELLESHGFLVKDFADGSSELYKPTTQIVLEGPTIMNLAHSALGAATVEEVNGISAQVIDRIERLGDGFSIELSGSKPSDAMFWFGMSGCTNDMLFDVLAQKVREEIARMLLKESTREVDILRILEKVSACNVHDDDLFKSIENDLYYSHPRSLIWLFRFGSRGRNMKQFKRNVLRHVGETTSDSEDAVSESEDTASESEDNTIDYNNLFENNSLPLIIDCGCGYGTTMIGLKTGGYMYDGYNMLGVDFSENAICYANGIRTRESFNGVRFVCADIFEALEKIKDNYAGVVKAALVQFPTPFKLEGGGNTQLPEEDDGFMVSERLWNGLWEVNCEKVLVQSNVEDVFLNMVKSGCGSGYEIIDNDEKKMVGMPFDYSVGGFEGLSKKELRITSRAERWLEMGGGSGGERAKVRNEERYLPIEGLTETEANCILKGVPVFREVFRIVGSK
ncbi:hypothetical protein TrLO_g9218 [Triparma laevis f. longispina]|uniref:tRNA (guanine(46)-N(7))-methyltransferase n=1 Tax=Triparma laevis f. longispina TaxID=1714387 RepID=A0A9W7F6X1_9STRA|nr:hypothetical protein TrLO_g9218 [Triparma laevis f. longispina]